ncbi:MAG: hypothetical protein M1402_04955 [Candidatus Thermoplasmatota archaeon]|nr:hypothetical protein [Candidatus Thermoplasmatota archaeon]MCL5665509.1 hypothetical protein [Candidatus Thermoplasmatota archaeon]
MEVKIESLDPELRFKVRLEISLRKNAIAISNLNNDLERYRYYINEREERIRKLLSLTTDPVITLEGKQIYP